MCVEVGLEGKMAAQRVGEGAHTCTEPDSMTPSGPTSALTFSMASRYTSFFLYEMPLLRHGTAPVTSSVGVAEACPCAPGASCGASERRRSSASRPPTLLPGSLSMTRSDKPAACVSWGYPNSTASSRIDSASAPFSRMLSDRRGALRSGPSAFSSSPPGGQKSRKASRILCRSSNATSAFVSHRVAATATTFDAPGAFFQTYVLRKGRGRRRNGSTNALRRGNRDAACTHQPR